MGIRDTLRSTRRIVEWGQELSYRITLEHTDTSFEKWILHRIERRERENRGKPSRREDFVLFAAPGGTPTRDALTLISRAFENNPEAVLVYADEDVPAKNRWEGEEYEPWLKPMWSPEFFLSCFYFGNFFAIRKTAYDKFLEKKLFNVQEVVEASIADEVERRMISSGWEPVKADRNGVVNLRPGENESHFMDEETFEDLKNRSVMRYYYRMCYEILLESGAFERHGASKVIHIPEILFHAAGSLDVCRIFDTGALKLQGISNRQLRDRILQKAGMSAASQVQADRESISIVIPSKDHPEILRRCIASVREETDYDGRVEIIVVDNGSTQQNRALIEADSTTYDFTYLYEPMEFNFSKMCNIGAGKATGDYILLLNDDMEVIQSNWLCELADRARMPYAGAVGAKLLYPGTTKIQHAGITNIRLGPTHKLQRMDDNEVYYFGQNRMAHDMLGVTGACLMLRRELYEAVGGLRQELRVAFNDVDLCFTLFEKGYSNVQCNDVILYHHESLSRGNDLEDETKTKRLAAEMHKLFELHPDLFATDPYYPRFMTFDVSDVGYTYYFRSIEFSRQIQLATPKPSTIRMERVREDSCLYCGVEYHDALKGWLGDRHTDTPADSYLQGYSFIVGSNNACYERKLLLQDEGGKVYEILIKPQYRPDIAQNVPDQRNVELSGFAVQIPEGKLAKGNYRIGLYARKRLAKEEILRWTTCYLNL